MNDTNGHNSRTLPGTGVLKEKERHRSEERLREVERKYQELVQYAPTAIYEIDFRRRRFTSVNDAMCLLSGYSREELLTMEAMEILNEEGRARFRARIGRWLRGEELEKNVEYKVRTKDGRVRDVVLNLTYTMDQNGEPFGATVVAHDVTERKAMEEALRSSQEQYRELVESCGSVILRVDKDMRITYMNEFGLEFFGYTREELIGRNALGTIIPEKDEQGHDTAVMVRDVIRRPEAYRTNVHQSVCKDGRRVWMSWTNRPIYNADRERGFAELVMDMCADLGPPEAMAFLQRIVASAERMDLLITDALNYSKAVRQELPLGPVDLGPLLRGMLDSYPEFQSDRARIQLDGELPPVMGNEAGLTQCFSNLLGNAVKFVAPGATPEVRVWSEARDCWVRIWVEDHGIGISPGMMPRIFHMFSRGQHDYEGTGIGLALVRKVVERMRGRVGVESQEGQGSRFWVELRPGDIGRLDAD